MDFMWSWVVIGLVVEVVRQTHQHCYPKKKPVPTAEETLREPLLQPDGTCAYPCCVKDIEAHQAHAEPESGESSDGPCSYRCCAKDLDYETGAYSGESSDEIVPDEIVSAEEIEEENRDKLIDKRKARVFVKGDSMQVIIGTIYPAGSGSSKRVQIKVSENGGAAALNKGAYVKIHPQPKGEAADQVHSEVGRASYKGKGHVEYEVSPPTQEVMSAHDGIAPGGGH